MSFSFLNPTYFVHKIDYIYYKEETGGKKSIQGPMRMAI
jgi:hypothetical protein